MKDDFEQLVTALNVSPVASDVLHQIIHILEQQTDHSLSSFVSKFFSSLLTLEHWAWQLLTQDAYQWINKLYYQELFHTIASFNKNLIFNNDNIEIDVKASLLFSVTIDEINRIFQQIEQSTDDNDPFITIVSLWFDNHSFFLHDNPHYNLSDVINYMNHYIARNYIMNNQFKLYLSQLQQSHLKQLVFTAKLLFYIRTSLFCVSSYLSTKNRNYPFTAEELLRFIANDYIEIIHIHSRTVSSWNKELLACIPQLIIIIVVGHYLGESNKALIKIIFPTEQVMCNHVLDLINIIAHKPFQSQIRAIRSNDETILIDASLMMLRIIVHSQDINWFFRSNTTIQYVLFTVAETALYDKICLCGYTILGTVLTDEQLKKMKIADSATDFFFNMLQQAWHHPSKAYKHIPISGLLQYFHMISKNDSVQQKTADLNRMSLFIDLCDQYPIVYQIFWTLSFNQDIQQQLRSSSIFMSKLSNQASECNDEQMRKIIQGILWNLEIKCEDRPSSEIIDGKTFDIMISYSHKDKTLCQQIYDELIKAGYRVWIDFDQIHGNVMDAMAQAIERSHTVIICISEDYRKSNYCRAEAHYAFQRQRKIVPVILQKHYKPDGWLLFLIGQLFYVDFHKHEFIRAMEILIHELKMENITKEDTYVVSSISSVASSRLPQTILGWTQTQVQQWLIEHNLPQMSRLLVDCDGRSLIYLSQCVKHGDLRCILNSLQEDSLRRTNENLSFIELARFLSLMDQQKKAYSINECE